MLHEVLQARIPRVVSPMPVTDAAPWFSMTAQANFETYLPDVTMTCLQLGCFAGDATAWMLEHLPLCSVVDVDTFEGSDEHEGIDMAQVKSLYDARFQSVPITRLMTLVGTTAEWLPKLKGFEFDFIYIDADHHAVSVLLDGVMAWPLLRPGGLLAFDDYAWGQELDLMERPQHGIDTFVAFYYKEIEIVEAGSQVWLRKLAAAPSDEGDGA